MAEEIYSLFVKNVKMSLDQKDIAQALTLFKDNKNYVDIQTNCWDLIAIVCKFLTFQTEVNDTVLFECCHNLLDIIVDIANPEEVLLQFIEEIEEATDDSKFLTLLRPLQKCLMQLPKKRLNSLAWCFNSIYLFLNKIEPDNHNEESVITNDCDTKRIIDLYKKLLPFYNIFIQETKTLDGTANEQNAIVCKFLVQLLDKPLIFLDMNINVGVKGEARMIVEDIVQKIFSIVTDPFSLLHLHSGRNHSELVKPNLLGLATLFYLVFSEEICIIKCPKVYNPVYFFHNSLFLATLLIGPKYYFCRDRGLKLAETLLRYVKHIKLSHMLLDSDCHSNFCKALADLIIYDHQKYIRKLALSIYKIYLNSFDTRGFYLLISNLLNNLNHWGLVSFTITEFKNKLAEEFINENNLSVYCKGPKLLKLLRQICYLYKNETDLVEISDPIIATLNILRYLTLRDKYNVTQIWDYIGILENIYFYPLKKSVELSKTHYELKLKDVNKHSSSRESQLTSQISIMVDKENLPEVSKNEKINMLQSSLITIDVIDCLLSRVLECIQLNKH